MTHQELIETKLIVLLGCKLEMMRASLPIIQIGNSLGFAIPDDLARPLGLRVGTSILVETEQVADGERRFEIKLYLRGKIIKSGGKHGGFIIGGQFIRALNIHKAAILNADIKVETLPPSNENERSR